MTAEPDGAVAVPERERVGLVGRLIVVRWNDLDDGVGARRRDERVSRERERLAERESPVASDLLGRAREPGCG
jgi:hypothetical protein